MKPHKRASTRTCHHKPDFQRYDFVACSPSQFLQWICAPRHEIITLELQRFEVFMLLYFQRYDFVSGCANPLQKLGRGASNEIVRLTIWLMMTCPGHWYAVCIRCHASWEQRRNQAGILKKFALLRQPWMEEIKATGSQRVGTNHKVEDRPLNAQTRSGVHATLCSSPPALNSRSPTLRYPLSDTCLRLLQE